MNWIPTRLFRLLPAGAALLLASSAFARPYLHDVAIAPDDTAEAILEKAANVVPSPRQQAFLELGFTGFIHFGPNTFSGVEWGTGREDPTVFHPGEKMDTDQWCRTAKAAGMKMLVITVKHHDGFCTWQTRYNDQFSVRATPWLNGKGDVLRSLTGSCRKYGLKVGVYLSPADLHQMEDPKGYYGNDSRYRKTTIPTDPASFLTSPEKIRNDKPAGAPSFEVEADDYNRYFMNQLYELLTEYGAIHEVWFDGANPKPKGNQAYLKAEWFEIIRALAPEAVIFGGPDVRWCGNEAGRTRESEWNVIPVAGEVESGEDRPQDDIGSNAMVVKRSYDVYGKKHAANSLFYIVPEIDTSIRAGWFFRNDTEQTVRSADDVFDIYERTTGGNGVFLLNVPPTKDGLFGDRDVACLEEVGRRIHATYEVEDAAKKVVNITQTAWGDDPKHQVNITVQLAAPSSVNRFVLREDVARIGQRVIDHALDAWVDGQWQEVAKGRTIGWKRILRFPAVTTDRFRVRVLDSRGQPALLGFSAHEYQPPLPSLEITRNAAGLVTIAPEKSRALGWKPHGQGDPSVTGSVEIRYTTDGGIPSASSALYQSPLDLPLGGEVKAVAISKRKSGAIAEARIPMSSKGWKMVFVSSEENATYAAGKAIDGDPTTFWHTSWTHGTPHPHELVIDLGTPRNVAGFTYLPRQDRQVPDSMIESGEVTTSSDGKTWSQPHPFIFGNLVNDPSQRTSLFSKPETAVRFFKLISKTGAAGKPYAGAAEIGLIGG